MGCWNHSCLISNLHILAGQKVRVFLLAKNKIEGSFCYNNALYTPCLISFDAAYDDYGGGEDASGFGLPIAINELKSQLMELEQGENEYHDLAVKKSDFTVDKMFEADHESRLGIIDLSHRYRGSVVTSDERKVDALYATLADLPEAFRRVTHVMIHGDIFNDIMNKWFIEDYVGENRGTAGYNNSYNHIYFKDIIADIPDAIEKIKTAPNSWRIEMLFAYQDPNLAGRYLTSFYSSSGRSESSIVNIPGYIEHYFNDKDWQGLSQFLEEAFIGLWISMFMGSTRKLWMPHCGHGSQSQEHNGYNILIQSMTDILHKENHMYDDDE